MAKNGKRYWLIGVVIILIIFNFFLIQADIKGHHKGLTFAMFDIGQGDALFIESPTGTQVLVDGGPPRKILGQISRMMPPFDKHLDAIIVTNPDLDHIGGFLDILKVYKVDKVFEPGTLNDSTTYQSLENEIQNKNIEKILAQKGMRLDLGGGAVIDILFPDRDVFDWSTNDGSIVAKLTYGNESVMLTGDATAKTESIIINSFPKSALESTVLKVGHHGSRTSTSEAFTQAVAPKYALISDGKDNKYGHPHQDTLDTLKAVGAQIFRTDILGTIIMQSDGTDVFFPLAK